jgi:hypothetical protein
LRTILDGQVAKAKKHHNDNAWLAWHVATLMRMKKIPRLQKLQHRTASKPQSPDQQWAIFNAMAHAMKSKQRH